MEDKIKSVTVVASSGQSVRWSRGADGLYSAGVNDLGQFIVQGAEGRLLAVYGAVGWLSAEFEYYDAA